MRGNAAFHAPITTVPAVAITTTAVATAVAVTTNTADCPSTLAAFPIVAADAAFATVATAVGFAIAATFGVALAIVRGAELVPGRRLLHRERRRERL